MEAVLFPVFISQNMANHLNFGCSKCWRCPQQRTDFVCPLWLRYLAPHSSGKFKIHTSCVKHFHVNQMSFICNSNKSWVANKMLSLLAALSLLTCFCFCCFFPPDAFVGGIIGLIFAYICYRQHYPPLGNTACHKSYVSLLDQNSVKKEERPTADNATGLPLEGITEGPVWLWEMCRMNF